MLKRKLVLFIHVFCHCFRKRDLMNEECLMTFGMVFGYSNGRKQTIISLVRIRFLRETLISMKL